MPDHYKLVEQVCRPDFSLEFSSGRRPEDLDLKPRFLLGA